MGFDEIQTIKTEQDPASGGSGGGSGSGGSGGGGGIGDIGGLVGDTGDMVTDGLNQVEEEPTGWAKRVLEWIKSIDFQPLIDSFITLLTKRLIKLIVQHLLHLRL